MSYQVNSQEFQSVTNLSASGRFSYFIGRVADSEQIWLLSSDNGWALMAGPEGEELVPVWPASLFAEACVSGDWAQYQPKSLSIHDWLDKWIPGMTRDGRRIALFPTEKDTGMVVEPLKLGNDIREAMSQYE